MTRILPALALLAMGFCLAVPKGGSSKAHPPDNGFRRGVVVSCPRSGLVWGTDDMADALSELRTLGVSWVAIHPYGWVSSDGSVRPFRPGDRRYLERAAEMARNAGVQLFWKPHLGCWGSFEWRGAIEFGSDEIAWRRFFGDYGDFITEQAKTAQELGVPLFSVGVELEGTVHREREWRALISRIRSVYDGEIVYSANWDRVKDVPFWDAVDLIGVHAYFPLSENPSPSIAEIRSAWNGPLAILEKLSEEHDRPVLIAEIGYDRSANAAAEPWVDETRDSDAARSLRARLIEAAIQRLEAEPWIVGMFWWKWMPGTPDDIGDESFAMRAPEARAILRRYWGPSSRPDPSVD